VSSLAMQRTRGPFAGLLLAQLFFIATTPFLDRSAFGVVFLYAGVFGVMAAGVYVSAASRRLLTVSLVLFVAAAAAWISPDTLGGRPGEVLELLLVGLGYTFTAAIVVVSVSRHEQVTLDTILGGINAYLLIACAFTMFHAMLLVVDAGAITTGGRALYDVIEGGGDSPGFATLLYFSFTTLTTLGYGDMVPVTAVARLLTSIEAVIGQLYVAVFIARLVSLEVSQRTAPS